MLIVCTPKGAKFMGIRTALSETKPCAKLKLNSAAHVQLPESLKTQWGQNNYSKASRYTVSSGTDLDNATFLIGCKKI